MGAQFGQDGQRFVSIATGNELSGHGGDVIADGFSDHLGRDGGGGKALDTPLQCQREILFGAAEVLLEMFGYRFGVREAGKHVYKPEHLNLKGFAFHRPVHHLAHPVVLAKNRWGFVGDQLIQPESCRQDALLQIICHGDLVPHVSVTEVMNDWLDGPEAKWRLLYGTFKSGPGKPQEFVDGTFGFGQAAGVGEKVARIRHLRFAALEINRRR
jgi:hypothetical protein